MNCPKCTYEMEATGTTREYPNCNTWTCAYCKYVAPELGSLRLSEAERDRFRYARGVTPPDYVCSSCGASGVRLYRSYQGIPVELTCAYCTVKLVGKGINPEKPWSVGWYVLAVPDEECDGYWGYTSVPKRGLEWWKALPVGVLRKQEQKA